MKPALMASPILLLTAIALAGPAQALPAAPPRDAVAMSPGSALLPVRYHRHHHHGRAASHAPRETDSTGGIKAGQWQFTSELLSPAADAGKQPAAPPDTQPPAQPPAGSGAKSTYMACITSEKAVPAGIDPRCKLDDTQRHGAQISWSMSCASTRVRSDGVAQYRGDTMDGTMISHVPNASGAAMDLTQRITGRYIGPCTQSAQNQTMPDQTMPGQTTRAETMSGQTMPEATAQASNEAGGSLSPVAQSPATPENAAAQQAGDENAAAIAPSRDRRADRHARHHARYRHDARHRHHRYYRRWY